MRQPRDHDGMVLKRGDDHLLLRRETAQGVQSYVGYLNGVETVMAGDRPTAMRALLSAKATTPPA